MRGLVQRVARGRVVVSGEVVGEVGAGMVVLVGIAPGDTPRDVLALARKLLSLRLWPDDGGRPWARSVVDRGYGVLLVSQFTLYANTRKGTKPDFHGAMPSERSAPMFDELVAAVRKLYPAGRVETGRFGAHMEVELVNDGPVTILLEQPASSAPSAEAEAPESAAE
jgi:D-tyrosyl-tRNA(Tyr) deacylase